MKDGLGRENIRRRVGIQEGIREENLRRTIRARVKDGLRGENIRGKGKQTFKKDY